MSERVLAVLAGADMPPDLLGDWARSAQVVLAADAGADRLLEAGVEPHRIVGDFDSISDLGRFSGEIHHGPDQDSTDCDKLLALARELGHGRLTLAGLEGDRMDHAIASWLGIARSGLDVRVALRRGLGWIMRPGLVQEIPVNRGATISMLPLSHTEGVNLSGVEWPLIDRSLTWDGLVSISNKASSSSVQASLKVGVAILFAEYERSDMPWW